MSPPGAVTPIKGKIQRGRGKIPAVTKSRGPYSNALAYAERAMST